MANGVTGYKYQDVMRALENADASGNAEDAAELAKIANTLYTEGKSPKSYTWSQVPVNALLNFLPNMGEFYFNLGKMALNPQDTIPAFADLTSAVTNDLIKQVSPKTHEKLVELEQSIYDKNPKLFNAVTGGKTPEQLQKGYQQQISDIDYMVKENLLTEEGLKRTLAEKPFDVLSVLSPKTAIKATEVVGKGFQKAGTKALDTSEKFSKYLMQSALKPKEKQIMTGQSDTAVKVLLENNIPLNSKGVEILKGKIDDLNDKITQKVKTSEIPVNKSEVIKILEEVRKKYSNQANPVDDLAAIDKVETNFINSHPDILTAEAANKIKSGTYKAVGERAYGESKTAAIEAEKALARGLKEQVEKVDIDVAPINAEQKALIDTLKLTEQRVLKDSNRDVIGIAQANPTPESIAAVVLERAPLKSLISKYLYRGQKALRDPRLNAGFQSILGPVQTTPTFMGGGFGGILQPDERYTDINFLTGKYPR